MCDCDYLSVITDVPLMHDETVVLDFQGEGGFIGCSAECCPKDFGRLTNRRIIVLQKSAGFPVYSTALLENVTACSVGRQRPRWWVILPIFFTGFLVVLISIQAAVTNTSECDGDCFNRAFIVSLIGFSMILLAVWIFQNRPTAIHFFEGSKGTDNGFSIAVGNRGVALKLLERYYAAKSSIVAKVSFNTSVGSPGLPTESWTEVGSPGLPTESWTPVQEDSAPSPPTRLWTANGAPKVLPPTRADMTSKALAETEPEEKPKKLKKKKGAEDSVCANMLAAGPAQPPGYHGDRRAQPRHHEITATIEMQRHRRRTDSDV